MFKTLLFPVLFVAMWYGVTSLLSRVSGWARLADVYSGHAPDGLNWHWFSSGKIGYKAIPILFRVNYNNALCVAADAEYIYLKVLPPFRPGSPLLMIPLSDITITPTKRFGFSMAIYTFRDVLDIEILISERLNKKLETDNQASPPAA
jgi:hypothetical protein